MKKYIVGGLVGATLMFSAQGFAADAIEKVEAYIKNQPVKLNGQAVTLESPALVYDGSTYLKLRDAAKLTGLNVNWNEQTQTVEMQNKPQTGVDGGQASNNTVQSTPQQAQVQGNKNIGEGVTYYLASDVTKKYSPTSSRTLENGTVLWTINGKEIDQIQGMTDKDKFHVEGTNINYFSEQFYLKFLSIDQLNEFQRYNIDHNTGKITRIN